MYKPGQLVPLAVYQSSKKIYADEREGSRERQRLRREKHKEESYYASIGEWSPEDELPDPDENL